MTRQDSGIARCVPPETHLGGSASPRPRRVRFARKGDAGTSVQGTGSGAGLWVWSSWRAQGSVGISVPPHTLPPPLDARVCRFPGERADRPCTCGKAPTCTGLGVWGPTGLGCWHIRTQHPRVKPATLRPSEPHGALTAPFLPPGVKASPELGRKRAGRSPHTVLPAGARAMHASSFLPHVAAEGTVDSWGSRGPHFPHTDVSTALCAAPAFGDHSLPARLTVKKSGVHAHVCRSSVTHFCGIHCLEEQSRGGPSGPFRAHPG